MSYNKQNVAYDGEISDDGEFEKISAPSVPSSTASDSDFSHLADVDGNFSDNERNLATPIPIECFLEGPEEAANGALHYQYQKKVAKLEEKLYDLEYDHNICQEDLANAGKKIRNLEEDMYNSENYYKESLKLLKHSTGAKLVHFHGSHVEKVKEDLAMLQKQNEELKKELMEERVKNLEILQGEVQKPLDKEKMENLQSDLGICRLKLSNDQKSGEIEKKNIEIKELNIEIIELKAKIQKPHQLAFDNNELREEVRTLTQQFRAARLEKVFDSKVEAGRVQAERNLEAIEKDLRMAHEEEMQSFNQQVQMMFEQHTMEMKKMKQIQEEEMAAKNKEIEELNATIQLLKQW